jgi:hypothetical protein
MTHPAADTTPYSFQWAPAETRPCRCPRCLAPAEWLTSHPDVADGVSYLIRCPVCNPDAGYKPSTLKVTVRRAISAMHGATRCADPVCDTCNLRV